MLQPLPLRCSGKAGHVQVMNCFHHSSHELFAHPSCHHSHFSVRVKSGPDEVVGPYSNVSRHMAHTHMAGHVCAHIQKHLSHLPTWHKHKSDGGRPRCQGKSHLKQSGCGSINECACSHCSAHFPQSDTSMRLEQGSSELTRSLEGKCNDQGDLRGSERSFT